MEGAAGGVQEGAALLEDDGEVREGAGGEQLLQRDAGAVAHGGVAGLVGGVGEGDAAGLEGAGADVGEGELHDGLRGEGEGAGGGVGEVVGDGDEGGGGEGGEEGGGGGGRRGV